MWVHLTSLAALATLQWLYLTLIDCLCVFIFNFNSSAISITWSLIRLVLILTKESTLLDQIIPKLTLSLYVLLLVVRCQDFLQFILLIRCRSVFHLAVWSSAMLWVWILLSYLLSIWVFPSLSISTLKSHSVSSTVNTQTWAPIPCHIMTGAIFGIDSKATWGRWW